MKHIHLIIPDELGEQLRIYAKKYKMKLTPVITQAIDKFINIPEISGHGGGYPENQPPGATGDIIIKNSETLKVTTSPNALQREETTPPVQTVIDTTDDDGNTATRPDSTRRKCPFCSKSIYGEFAQKHYSDKHEGA